MDTVVVITANRTGGILQFAVQMRKVFEKLFGKAVLFVPSDCTIIEDENVKHFKRYNSLLPFASYYRQIANDIIRLSPKLVFVCESRLMMSRLVECLAKKSVCYMCVHDVREHPVYKHQMFQLKNAVIKIFTRKAWNVCEGIVLLSDKSLREFQARYPRYEGKCGLIPLGAHVPDVAAREPSELGGLKEYLLFFGRIEKYKGIPILLQAYRKIHGARPELVIAGEGMIPKRERKLIDELGIKLINRYIKDSEMAALFKNCSCVILPYTEASQSGVLSMAYYFGKPVAVSDLPGLREFVVQGKTGYIFRNPGELSDILKMVCNRGYEMEEYIKCYYEENLSWEKNVKAWLQCCGESV